MMCAEFLHWDRECLECIIFMIFATCLIFILGKLLKMLRNPLVLKSLAFIIIGFSLSFWVQILCITVRL